MPDTNPEDSDLEPQETETVPVCPPPLPPLPVGTQALLEAQLGEALNIMRDFSVWIHSPHADIVQCGHVSHNVSILMNSCAKLAKVAAGLQNGAPESRHRRIVEYVAPPEGGVRQKSKTNKPR